MEASPTPSGMVFPCLLVLGDVEIEFHQCLGQWLMFLLFFGDVLGFGSVYSSTLSPHTLASASCPPSSPYNGSAFDPAKRLYLVSKHSKLSIQGQEQPEEKHTQSTFVNVGRNQEEDSEKQVSPLKHAVTEGRAGNSLACFSLPFAFAQEMWPGAVSLFTFPDTSAMVCVFWHFPVEGVALAF